MSFFAGLGALVKIAGAVKSVMKWFSNQQLIEAGRDDVRADIASQEAKNDEKIRTRRNSIRNGDDADSVLDRFQNGSKE